jgi:predicted O-linked N-acetylglucosamine transferase (SPINDLY family)
MSATIAEQAAAALQQGLALHQQGRLDEARTAYQHVLRLEPENAAALTLLGTISVATNDPATALDLFARAIRTDPNLAEAHYARGNVLAGLKQWEAALADYDHAIAIKPDYAEALSNRGNVLGELKRWEAALASYDRAIAIKPDYARAWFNRGNALGELKRWEAALASYDHAIAIKPDYAEALFNRGNVLGEFKRWGAALASYDRAIAIKQGHAKALANRGNVLGELNQWEAALDSYGRALAADPAITFVQGHRCHTRLRLCNWDGLDGELARLTTAIERGEAAAEPFEVLALSGSARLQNLAAGNYVRERCSLADVLPAIRKRGRRDRIRVGYFSADFRNHPVSYLTAELFEEHDRSRLEVIGFSFGPDGRDTMRLRLEKAFDRFIDVSAKSDVEVALLARDIGLDLAIDLGGYTEKSRSNIFAHRAAPLQVSYIGYLGTMSAPFMDYLVADRTIVPSTHRPYYAEKILYLPSYQANDSKRRIADRTFTREELGLPQTGFVFCCLNAAYKVMPGVFTRWMRVLQAAPGSVLVLLGDNPVAQGNLRKEAQRQGVDPARLVFCNRLPRDEYLARFRAMDLFLDTLPYNAGTTASDALWAGLPVLTCTEESFASRMCASLLTAIDMPELISSTPEQYEQLAVALATHPERITKLRQQLATRRATTPLFDTRSFSRHLEAAYLAIYDRYMADLPPDDIEIPRGEEKQP